VPIFAAKEKHTTSGGNTRTQDFAADGFNECGSCRLPGFAAAQQPVKIGIIYPLSAIGECGQLLQDGDQSRADVINKQYRLAIMPLAKAAPAQPAAPDPISSPTSRSTRPARQTLQLIRKKVAALIGAISPGITMTASAIAERHGILSDRQSVANADAASVVFRTTPVAIDFARYSTFLRSRRRPARAARSPQMRTPVTPSPAIVDQFADSLP
jgi:branched-chain amino acid transport system substrate-binding protein